MVENTLLGRFKRYTNVTTAVGGLMARLLGDRYLGLAIDTPHHAAELKETLGSLKGPFMKIAQILATVPDMVPPEYATAFLDLQSNAPPMGWPFVKRRMQAELGPQWQDHFREFGREASAAASLGQVHKAIDLEGRVLACKLQYPEMGSAVEADLVQFKLLLKSFHLYSGAVDTKDLYQEISDRLWEELNYLREAKNIKLFSEALKGFSFVEVPSVIDDLTTPRLLTMTWLEGQSLLTLLDASQEVRNRVAISLFQSWYYPLYQYGILHGDPHLGNYTWSQAGTLHLLDFGCVRIFNASLLKGVLDLYHAIQKNDEELAVHAYRAWGFTEIDKDLIEILNQWARFLYGPFLEDRVRPLEETYSGLKGKQVASDILSALKRRGGVRPPREFVFMDRAAVGLGSVFMRLKAQVNWHRLFEELIKDFTPSRFEKQQQALFEKVGYKVDL